MAKPYPIDDQALCLIRDFQVAFFRADGLAIAVIPPNYDYDTFTEKLFDCEFMSEDQVAFLSQLNIFFNHAKFSVGTYAIDSPLAHTNVRADLPAEGFASSIEVCDHHLKLLKSARWNLHVMEDKRPFGNSRYVYDEMAAIMGMKYPSMLMPDGSINVVLEAKIKDVFYQLPMVLKAFLQHGQLAKGSYNLPNEDLRNLQMKINF